MRVIRYYEHGGPEVLTVDKAPEPVPGDGQLLVQVEAVGVNFIETQLRSGTAPFPSPVPRASGGGGPGPPTHQGPPSARPRGARPVTAVEHRPLLVVGAGPAGLSTAIFAGRHGVSPLVVERRPGTSTAVKATGQYPHTMEALRIAGVAERIHELSRPDRSEFSMVLAPGWPGPSSERWSAAGN
ncbi:FAD-dependent monooxygenase [Micromonospora sp. WMMD736]|uniref:FAD-dependent monooxygenase n=1 Tax=Micromonospora sp. WMMD736 TaxID=3404112 RepID=UPI003B95001F